MELCDDFLRLQGIFLNLEKNVGKLTSIKYKGGNEEKIHGIITDFSNFLLYRNYIMNKHPNDVYEQRLSNIALFLILNTELKNPIKCAEYQHLLNIMPQISKCILANIAIEVKLVRILCEALQKFSLETIEEVVAELVEYMKKQKVKKYLNNAFFCLQLFRVKISLSTKQDEEFIGKLTKLSSIISQNFTGLFEDEISSIGTEELHKVMGYALLNLLNLLLQCDLNNLLLQDFIENLLQSSCSVTMAVTVCVFLSWVEFKQDGQVFQSLVAERAYLFIEKYQEYEPAQELIKMLKSFARKPKTINEKIQVANEAEMISMVDFADEHQNKWFKALLNTQVLKNPKAVQCIDAWSHLCTLDDVSRLLRMNTELKLNNSDINRVILKCASNLDLYELVVVATRRFHSTGLDDIITDDGNLQQHLVILFNKLQGQNEVEDEFAKDLHLLLLQNPKFVLSYIFVECIKNSYYSLKLKKTLTFLKEVAHINNIGLTILSKEIESNKPSDENLKNYVNLFNILIEIKFYTAQEIVMEIILPVCKTAFSEQCFELLKSGLDVLNNLQEHVRLRPETDELFVTLFQIMKMCRCKFMEFDLLKQEIVKGCVTVVCCYLDSGLSYTPQTTYPDGDTFLQFYKDCLQNENALVLLGYFCPDISSKSHAEIVANLIKVLPLCVTQEWLVITSNLTEHFGRDKTVECICDSLILLCHLVSSQGTKTEGVVKMLNALKYNLQHVGIVIKEVIQPRLQGLEEDANVTKNVCRLLKDIPDDLKNEMGLTLANVLSERSLKFLRNNKNFVSLVASIKEPRICQVLTQKMVA